MRSKPKKIDSNSCFLTGKKIVLRPLKKSDRKNTIKWRNDSEIRDAQLGFPLPVTEKMEEKWFDRSLSGDKGLVCLAIESGKTKSPIGYIQLSDINWVWRTARLGITIGEKEMQERGFGTEAMKLFLSYCFTTLNLRRIWLEVVITNDRALALYKRIGFKKEGTFRKHVFVKGKYQDLVLLGILKKEFKT
ncbi:MAG: GNAT family N-acetyltransferase [Rhodospirillaceae bacterium]|nr:GNAT family N-acetyltransferase [Rhodospirillaceae bacterium]